MIAVGTGGTITGVARYLKEQKPDLLVVGADPEGSIYTSGDRMHPYLVEGVGEDFWPKTFDPSVVGEWVTVSIRHSFLTARRMAREEGLLIGGSGGTAVPCRGRGGETARRREDGRYPRPRLRPRVPLGSSTTTTT